MSIIYSPKPEHKCRIPSGNYIPGTILQCECGKYWRARKTWYGGWEHIETYEMGPLSRWWHRKEIKAGRKT